MAMDTNLIRCGLTAAFIFTVFGKLPVPQNVKMHTINFKNLLQWSPVTYHKGNVNYSVEYQSYYDKAFKKHAHFKKGCTSITMTECDLSILSVMVGYYLRVRAEYENETSEWAVIDEFEPSVHTEIGPPSVVVKPRLDMLDVNIIGPVNENNYKSMQEYFLDLAYKVSYWKVGEEEKVESINTNQKMTTLTNLEAWTTYCLKVEPVLHNRKTHPSSIVCGTTMDNGRAPVWQVIVTLLASICVVFGVTMGIFYSSHYIHRAVKHSFQPSYNLPEHIKEYLKEPSLTSQFLLPPPNMYEESFDKLSIISDIQQSFDNTNIDMNTNMEMVEKQP
ncbi:interleukin-10 receptor subunit beta-like [Chiloscyllium punctatum]